jgi:uncharacterized protein
MTGDISAQLLALHEFLVSEAVSEDAMLLGELDGFLAGVIVCPELIQPGEWMPLIWGEAPPAFADETQAQQIYDLIIGHYNDTIAQLNKRRYEPIFEHEIDDSALWEIWIEGFARAMDLRPGCMVGLAERQRDDEDIQRAVFVFGRLCSLVLDPHLSQVLDIDAELEEHAPDLIASHVEILHQARLAEGAASRGTAPRLQPKIGRNVPVPADPARSSRSAV